MNSVFQKRKECFICANPRVHEHHIFEGYGRRKNSEKRGLKIFLCPMHHNMSNEGVHFNKPMDIQFKQMAQEYYESHYGTREDFIREFSKSYL